jgi:hypothetical protein
LKAGKIAPKPKPPIVAGLTGIHPVGVPVELPQPVPRNAQPRILAAKPPVRVHARLTASFSAINKRLIESWIHCWKDIAQSEADRY